MTQMKHYESLYSLITTRIRVTRMGPAMRKTITYVHSKEQQPDQQCQRLRERADGQPTDESNYATSTDLPDRAGIPTAVLADWRLRTLRVGPVIRGDGR